MKLGELPNNTDTLHVLLRVPEEIQTQMLDFGCEHTELYPAGFCWAQFMMSPHPPGTKERRLYPLPCEPTCLLDWDVIEQHEENNEY